MSSSSSQSDSQIKNINTKHHKSSHTHHHSNHKHDRNDSD